MLESLISAFDSFSKNDMANVVDFFGESLKHRIDADVLSHKSIFVSTLSCFAIYGNDTFQKSERNELE